MYSGDPYNTPEVERLSGLRAALMERGAKPVSEFIVGNNEITGGETGAQAWLENPHQPSAIFCSNDMLAMGFITEIYRSGASVPGDVSVVGHDDVPFAGMFKIPLTTVGFSTAQMGQKAMEILLARLRRNNCCDSPQEILLEPEIIVRSSCISLE